MLLKRQELIAQKVNSSPAVSTPVQTMKAEEKANPEKPVEPVEQVEPTKKVETIGRVEPEESPKLEEPVQTEKLEKPKEPIEIEESVQSVKSDDLPKNPSTDYKLQTTNSQGNPNAILELTKADIFKLLGMSQIPETEKKKNLDEMEETIWADFVEEDLPKMLKPDEKGRFEDLLKTAPSAEKVINFFGSPPSGGLPSDFEEKYLAKTLEFKAEIAKEQIETLLESVDDPQKKESLQKAKDLAANGFWKQVEDLMVAFG
jgi:hypothetical protein